MYGYPVGNQGFTQIAQEGSQFLHMLNHLVGNRDIEPPRRITPTGIPRDDANARLPIDTGMARGQQINGRSEEHTSELQSLMSISYAVFCLKQNTQLLQE